ncbi:hypothetical protein DV515_00006083 [Chloebia gouldiae]|uniref:Uncharacterized protein n=1 Tax=Chloebia gouldiae TaxID=44316 RepID=A0A3L8SLS8_CHLGU|nr:hypothetical protein DV515_00006083 [Chloebia gouldiae]
MGTPRRSAGSTDGSLNQAANYFLMLQRTPHFKGKEPGSRRLSSSINELGSAEVACRKPAAYHRSFVKCVPVSCVTARRYECYREGPVQLEWDVSCQFDVAGEKEEIVVFRERRSHSVDRKQRIPNSFQTRSPKFLVSDSTKPEVTAGLRSIAKTPGPEGEPAGIQARNPKD